MKKTLLIIGLLLSCIGSIQAMDENGVGTTKFDPWVFRGGGCLEQHTQYYQFTSPKKEGSALPDEVVAAIAIGCRLHLSNASVEHYRGSMGGVFCVEASGRCPANVASLHDHLAQVGLKTISNGQIVELLRRRLQKAKLVCGSSGEDESSDSEDSDSSLSSDSESE